MRLRFEYAAFLALGALFACGGGTHSPAPVLQLGIHADSATGAMIVDAGDTLWSISRRYRLPLREIIDLNNIQPPYTLAEGQRLRLPAPVDYRVRPGDTLHRVAAMFSVPQSRLVAVNGLAAPYRLGAGQVLRIPRRESDTPPQTQTQIAQVEKPHAAPPHRQNAQKKKPIVVTRRQAPLGKPAHFIWPVSGKVVSGYGAKAGGLFNDGINIAAPRGTPVVAAADGVVAYEGDDLKSYGNLVLIRHGGGMMTAYAHLSTIHAGKGTAVRKGQVIGTVGSTGSVASSQLHFELRRGSETLNPQSWLG